MFAEFYRGFHGNMAVQITWVAGANALDPLAAKPELLTGLGALRYVDGRLASECGYIDFPAQSSSHHADRD